MRLTVLIAATGIVGLLPLGSSPPAYAAADVHLELDTFRADNSTPIDVEGPLLLAGKPYRITVSGTYSYWFAEDWADHGACPEGAPEDMPMFPSPGTENGPVNGDAAWFFGGPNDLSECDLGPFPQEDDPFGISLDGGNNWDGLDPDDRGAAPNPSHTYHKTVIGQGAPVLFGQEDEKTEDNYGILKFTVEPLEVTWGDNDCNQKVLAPDGLLDLLASLTLPTPDTPLCPQVGDALQTVTWGTLAWGDLDCSNVIDQADMMLALREVAGLPPANLQECPTLGVTVALVASG